MRSGRHYFGLVLLVGRILFAQVDFAVYCIESAFNLMKLINDNEYSIFSFLNITQAYNSP